MKTILLIENNPDILGNLTEAFEMEGYKVLAAYDGIMGIKLAIEFMPDLIVSAILIGKMDGYMVLQTLLESPKTFGIPFIFSTTKSERKDKMLTFEIGADDYIVKPYELENIFKMTKTWIKSGSHRIVKRVSSYQSIMNINVFSNCRPSITGRN